ncbi:restriction endonuclease subunit S [Acinetobacter pittii]|uniref:restriction endonuclease subunit S n=1 Tax=Acinetobacter pittii TaxID=48296 RepID=UPI003A1013B2
MIDIFNIKNTSNILSRDIIQDSGIIPYLCASSENNGVSSYISYDLKYLEEGGCIFIGGKTFVVTYQEKDFFSNDSHNLTLKLGEFKHEVRQFQKPYDNQQAEQISLMV